MPPSVKLPDLTILSGQSESEEMDFTKGLPAYAGPIVIYAPSTLPETINIQVQAPGASTWKILHSGGSAITVAADAAVPVTVTPFGKLRMHSSSGNVAADRVFNLSAAEKRDI